MLARDRHQLALLARRQRITLEDDLDAWPGLHAEHQVHRFILGDETWHLGQPRLVVPLSAQLLRVFHQTRINGHPVVGLPAFQPHLLQDRREWIEWSALHVDCADARPDAWTHREHQCGVTLAGRLGLRGNLRARIPMIPIDRLQRRHRLLRARE
jgi:hypothetical protein